MSLVRFDGFEFDHAAYRLRHDGERVAVEPKVLELLAFLIEHRDRVVSKQELLDAVWPDQYVTESVLTQSVYEIRKALGESSRDQGRIRTVHGRGYQFRGEVEVVEPESPVEREPTTESRPEGQAERRRPRHTVWLAAVLIAALSVTAWVRWGRNTSPPAETTLDPRRSVAMALLPIEPNSSNPQFSLLALSMTDLLTLRLQEIPGITLRGIDYVVDPTFSYDSIEQFALEAGVTHVLTGSLQAGADQNHAVLSARLAEVAPDWPARSVPLGSFELPLLRDAASTSRFTQARDDIAGRLLKAVLPALPQARPEAGMTSNVEAYRLYLTAIQSMLANTCDQQEAIGLLSHALELDPGFAYAALRLSWAHYVQVWACGADAVHYQHALVAAEQALEISPSLIDAHYVESTILVETGRVEEAYRHVQRAPRNVFHGFTREYPLRFAGYLSEAEKWMRIGLESDPLFYSTSLTGEAPNVLLYQNRFDEYLATLSAGDSAYHRFYRGLAEYLRGNDEIATEILEPAFRKNPEDVFGRFAHALLSIIEGDLEAARVIVRKIIDQRRSLDATDGEMTYKQAQLLALAGDVEGALEEFRLAVESGFVCVPYFAIDPAIESLRARPDFGEVYRQALDRHLAFGRMFDLTQYLPEVEVP